MPLKRESGSPGLITVRTAGSQLYSGRYFASPLTLREPMFRVESGELKLTIKTFLLTAFPLLIFTNTLR